MRVIKLQTGGTVTKLSEQHIQNKTRMDKFEEDENGLQKRFLTTCYPNSFLKSVFAVCNL